MKMKIKKTFDLFAEKTHKAYGACVNQIRRLCNFCAIKSQDVFLKITSLIVLFIRKSANTLNKFVNYFEKTVEHEWLPTTTQAKQDKPKKSVNLIFWIGTSLFLCFIIWANVFHIDEFAHANGEVETTTEEEIVTHLEGGIIDKILVKEGQHVKKEQTLMILKNIPFQTSKDDNAEKYFSNLGHIARLHAQIDGKDTFTPPQKVVDFSKNVANDISKTFQSHKESLKNQQKIIMDQKTAKELELKEHESRVVNLKTLLELSEREVSIIKPLADKNYVAQTQLIRTQKDKMEKKIQLDTISEEIPKIKAQISELKNRLEQVKNDARQKDHDELKQREVEVGTAHSHMVSDQDRVDRSKIISPVDGIVKSVHTKTLGSSIVAGKEIVTIIPVDEALLIAANVMPKDIGFISKGNPVNIKITAFDYSIFGSLKGKVIHISPNTFLDEKKQPYFKVKIATTKSHFDFGKLKLSIAPGMTAQVDFLTGRKTIMHYILKPIIKTLDESLGEK